MMASHLTDHFPSARQVARSSLAGGLTDTSPVRTSPFFKVGRPPRLCLLCYHLHSRTLIPSLIPLGLFALVVKHCPIYTGRAQPTGPMGVTLKPASVFQFWQHPRQDNADA